MPRGNNATHKAVRQHARKAENPYQRTHVSQQPDRESLPPQTRSERRADKAYFPPTCTTEPTYDIEHSSSTPGGGESSAAGNNGRSGKTKTLKLRRETWKQRMQMMGIKPKETSAKSPETEQTATEDPGSCGEEDVPSEQPHDEEASSEREDASDMGEILGSDDGDIGYEDSDSWDGGSVISFLAEALDAVALDPTAEQSSSQPRKLGGFKGRDTWSAPIRDE